MRDEPTKYARRRFIDVGLAGIAALQVAKGTRIASASELPRIDEADATAKALAYVHDASAVSVEIRGDASRNCGSCRFYTRQGEPWGPCALFPSSSVSAQGWCKGWVAKQ